MKGPPIHSPSVTFGSTPERFAVFMKTDMAKWSKLIKEVGIHDE